MKIEKKQKNQADFLLPPEIARELGKRGGRKVVEKYGKDYFSRIGKIGAQKRWKSINF